MQFVKPVLNEISKADECKTHKLNNRIQILPKAKSLHWLISLLHIKVALPNSARHTRVSVFNFFGVAKTQKMMGKSRREKNSPL